MDLNDELLARVRDIVERSTGRPAYMADDEEWAVALDSVLADAKKNGIPIPSPPVCQYCGEVAPYGDERIQWLSVHEGIFHRLYYGKIKEIRFLKSRRPG